MTDLVHVDTLLAAMAEQGLSVEDPKLHIAIRKATNPEGCEWCGARTKMAIPVNPKKPEGAHKLACCGRKVV